MEAALYHPELGYYARRTRQVGREGDFFTSVSVGPLFGRLLARRFINWWQGNGSPSPWRVIESGAHDGTLASDILAEISALNPEAAAGLEYIIPEPLPLLRATQKWKLGDFPQVRFIGSPAEIHNPLPGIAFGNELLDALPFHVIRRSDGAWKNQLVGYENDNFVWIDGPSFPGGPEGDFPDGYTTEIRTCFTEFFKPLLGAISHGLLIWPDYGYERADYYHPSRTTGTLRTFSKHRAGEDPLSSPGEADITAHVDFTDAANAASSLGCEIKPLVSQSSWLTHLARELLLSMEGNPDPSLLRQFQTLTHPGQLGSRFHILELVWPGGDFPSP